MSVNSLTYDPDLCRIERYTTLTLTILGESISVAITSGEDENVISKYITWKRTYVHTRGTRQVSPL